MIERLRNFADWVAKGSPNHPKNIRLRQVEELISLIEQDIKLEPGRVQAVLKKAPDFTDENYAVSSTNPDLAMHKDVAKWNRERLAKLKIERSALMESLGKRD